MTELVKIAFDMSEVANLRNKLGQFTSEGIGAQRSRNETVALNLQAEVVQRMKNRISFGKRASASTGRLLYATAASGNRRFDTWSMGVGVPKFLDSTQAKYWRTFEEGSLAVWKRPFIGTQLLQFKKNPSRFPSAHGTDLRTAGDNFFGYQGGEGRFVVKKEIEPANIYKAVASPKFLRDVGTQQALLVLDRIFRVQVSPRGGYFNG